MNDFPEAMPHGALTRVADDVYLVRGSFKLAPGVAIGRTMAVVKHGDELTVLNSVRLSQAGEAELERIGRVAHVVKLSDHHGLDDPYYVRRFQAVFWSLPAATHPGLERGMTLGPEGPIPGAEVIVLGDTRSPEAAYRVPQGGGTLVACDALQNCVDTEGASFLGRVLGSALGFKGGMIVPPMWKKTQGLAGETLRSGLAGLCAKPFENLVAGHGPALVGGAADQVRAAIAAG